MVGWEEVLGKVKPYIPVAFKRGVKRRLPRRYHHYFDPDWHRRTIRRNIGHWDYLGRLQLDYLVAHGLEPRHYLLDVGCGPLRAGVHFIGYLEPGHYAGVDKHGHVLETAQLVELRRYGLEEKQPTLLTSEHFEFGKLGRTFDFAIAQSVFTHLPLNAIRRCLVEMEKVLTPDGRFYATIHENPFGKTYLGEIQQSEQVVSYPDRDRYHYDLDTLRTACEGTGLTMAYEGSWGHPENQKMIAFSREAVAAAHA